MAKSIAKSCPLCLSVNDPVDMLPVTMEHSTPPQTAPLYLCRLCVIQIMKATLQTDVVDPREVFGDVPGDANSPAEGISSGSVSEVHDPGLLSSEGEAMGERDSAPVRDEEPVRVPTDEGDSEG